MYLDVVLVMSLLFTEESNYLAIESNYKSSHDIISFSKDDVKIHDIETNTSTVFYSLRK